MKTVKVKRPKIYWANYSYKTHGYEMVRLQVYSETTSEYHGATYYHHRHILTIKFQANFQKIRQAYGMQFEFDNDHSVEIAYKIVGKLIKSNTNTLKGTLRELKKLHIPKYIYSANSHQNFLPYAWRNNEDIYFQMLA